jgi:hypothetical protein
MTYWTDEKGKTVGIFDPDAKLNIPFDWRQWIAVAGSTYQSHVITVAPQLEVIQSSNAGGIITVRVGVLAGQTVVAKQLYSVKCHIVLSDGQADDRTVYLKMIER